MFSTNCSCHLINLDSLPRIENALPGRDGYEVEIFGMEGIPAPDAADFKRQKEIELGLAAGTISQPQAKPPKIDNRIIPEDELRRQLQEHKALMGLNNPDPSTIQESASAPAVYGAPQSYASPPVPLVPNIPPNPAPFLHCQPCLQYHLDSPHHLHLGCHRRKLFSIRRLCNF